MFLVIAVVIIRTNWSINMKILFCPTAYLFIIFLHDNTDWCVNWK